MPLKPNTPLLSDSSIIVSSNRSKIPSRKAALSKTGKKTFDFALFLSQLEDAMLSNAVSFIECSALFFATLRALFSILNPKVKDTSYYLLILLPISLLLPAMAQAKSVDENGVDVE